MLGVLVTGVVFLTVPGLTHFCMANMGYWVDWANQASVALGLGAVATVFFWPLLALFTDPARRA